MLPPVFANELYKALFAAPSLAPWQPAKVFETQQERAKHQVRTKMRTHVFKTVGEMSTKELKQTCALINATTDGFLEKAEFARAVEERRESSCGFCMEEFAAGEVVHATACGHLGHEGCFAAWFGRSAAKSLYCWNCRAEPFLSTPKRKRK